MSSFWYKQVMQDEISSINRNLNDYVRKHKLRDTENIYIFHIFQVSGDLYRPITYV